jgi:hypothetical protein
MKMTSMKISKAQLIMKIEDGVINGENRGGISGVAGGSGGENMAAAMAAGDWRHPANKRQWRRRNLAA